jgi:CBS domain-containing protein
MTVDELMTKVVITVSPETTLKDAAAILAERRVSGVPVVDTEGAVVGVFSEGDVLYRESGGAQDGFRFAAWPGPPDHLEAKLDSTIVGESMSSPAVTIGVRSAVTDAAKTMIGEGVNRLPVIDDEGRLVGIVTRADLVRAFVRSDDDVADEICDDVLGRQLWLEPDSVRVEVEQGRVRLTGQVESQTDADLVSILAKRVPGVVSLDSRLSWLDQNGRLDGRSR